MTLVRIITKQTYRTNWLEVGLLAAVLMAWSIVLVRTAWLSDDSMITLRQVLNLTNGLGIVWNPDQRLQGFTHPTWFLMLSTVILFTRELFATTIVVSALFSLLSVTVVLGMARSFGNVALAIVPLMLLLLSDSFVDYSTSGLENPLTHFLLGAVVILNIFRHRIAHGATFIFVLMALVVLNRFDLALLLLPLALFLWAGENNFALKPVIPGGIILFSWIIFAVFYFGMPLPNTFYAKLGAGYPIGEQLERGLIYFYVNAKNDPVTLLSIIVAVVMGSRERGTTQAIALGLVLYLIYILCIGGDFMQGRFLSPIVFVSAFVILKIIAKYGFTYTNSATSLLLVGAGLFGSWSFATGADYKNHILEFGITDERGYYYQQFGLLSPDRVFPNVVAPQTVAPNNFIVACGGIGRWGLRSGLEHRLIDSCGLTDPFLARLPAIHSKERRIGHPLRKVPFEYPRALLLDESYPKNGVAELYKDLVWATSAPLFSHERFSAIYRLNISRPYNFVRGDFSDQRISLRKQVPAKILRGKLWLESGAGSVQFNLWPEQIDLADGPVEFQLTDTLDVRTIKLSLKYGATYFVELVNYKSLIAGAQIFGGKPPSNDSFAAINISFNAPAYGNKVIVSLVEGDGAIQPRDTRIALVEDK